MQRLACTLLSLAVSAATWAGETLTLRADHWMPFNGDPHGGRPGFVIELARAIYTPHGITVDYQVLPWARAVKGVEDGQFDGAIAATREDVPDAVFPSEPLGNQTATLFVPAASAFQFHGVQSLNGVRFGCVNDYSYSDELDAYIAANPGGSVNALAGDKPAVQAVVLLQRGRLDVFVEDASVFREAVREAGAEASAFRAAATLATKPLYIAFSPRRPTSARFAQLYDEGVARLRASGELQQLLAKYGMVDWR
jgi:polar amino acid transport system substrate-binding protein